MNHKSIILAFTLITASLGINNVQAQNQDGITTERLDSKDSTTSANQIEAKAQETRDDNTMANAKAERKATKAKAKNAKRIERDADNAAKQSKYAVRSERKAQRSRKQANDQAEKASKARDKSDNN